MKHAYLMACLLAGLAHGAAFEDQFSVPLGEKAPDGNYHKVPDWSAVPEGEMGAAIKRGYSLFVNTQQLKVPVRCGGPIRPTPPIARRTTR